MNQDLLLEMMKQFLGDHLRRAVAAARKEFFGRAAPNEPVVIKLDDGRRLMVQFDNVFMGVMGEDTVIAVGKKVKEADVDVKQS